MFWIGNYEDILMIPWIYGTIRSRLHMDQNLLPVGKIHLYVTPLTPLA